MSQFAAAGKTQPPWARATVAPGAALAQGPGPASTSALGASLLGAQATAHTHVAAASAAAAGQTLTATGVHASQSLAAAAAAVAAAQSQQAVTANPAAAYGTSLTLGLTQNALQAGTVISQSGIAIPASLAPTAPVGTPGIALPTTLATTQVATVTYPAPRLIAQATQFQAPPPQHAVPQQPPPHPPQQIQQMPPKQRVFTGTVTKLHDNFGFVDEDVFFQLGVVKGAMPKVGERVLVEASFNPNMPFKWNGTRIQVLPNQINVQSSANSRPGLCSTMQQVAVSNQSAMVNSNMPPVLAQQVGPGLSNMGAGSNSNQGQYSNMNSSGGGRPGLLMPPRRHPSPPPSIRRERDREVRREDRRDRYRADRERDYERERYSPPSRKRSRSPRRRSQSPPPRRRSQSPPARRRSNSPPRRRPRIVSRYTVQIPKVSLDVKESHVLELRKRYTNLYIPSDFFHASIHWQDAFPCNRAFSLDHPCSFHIMHKDVDPVSDKEVVTEPTDADHLFSAKVMLMATPPLSEIYRKACSLAEDPEDVRDNFVHPTRLINFLVGVKGKNETVAIGGPWSPSLDGPDPLSDPQVLIRTAIRTCKALTGIDLSCCSHWYRFADIFYRRGESTHKGRTTPARVETVVLFLPDVWSCMPTQLEWDTLSLHYKKQFQEKMHEDNNDPIKEEEEAADEDHTKNEPTHHSELDPKTMTVVDLRRELESRNLSSKGLKSQLIARLTKCLKTESDKENEKETEHPSNEDGGDEEMKPDGNDKDDEKTKKEPSAPDATSAIEEEKKNQDKEKQMLTRRYNLPATPSIIVHPSRTAKGGKFDCTVMSLSVLLDYRQEDNKEHSFEVSLFAELFNEMLMRDFGFAIYQALAELEEKDDDKDKRKSDKKNERKEKDDKDDRKRKEDGDDDTDKDDDDTEDDKDDDDERKDKDKRRKGSGKKDKSGQMVTFDPHLLLSFVYFDQNHCGYILEKDLEDIIFILGLYLSRAQVRRLLQKVIRRDTFHYRKLTDKPQRPTENSETTDGWKRSSANLDELAAGNKRFLPVFKCIQNTNLENSSPMKNGGDVQMETDTKEDHAESSVLMYQGALVDVEKLMKQLERSEKARTLTEQKLKKLQDEVAALSASASEREQKINRLSSEMEEQKQRLKLKEEWLHDAQHQVDKFNKALQSCQEQMKSTLLVVNEALNTSAGGPQLPVIKTEKP